MDGGFFQHLFLVMASLLGLVGMPAPLPLPPAPEDPALLRAAPADCLVCVQWFGSAEPAAAPTNRTERLAAEPEVRAMVAQLVAGGRAMLQGEMKDGPRAPDTLALYDLVVDAMQRPGVAFLGAEPPIAAGFVVRFGDDAQERLAVLEKGLAAIGPRNLTVETRSIDGVEFRGLRARAEEPFFGWAAIDGYLVVAIGEPSAQQMVRGLSGKDQGLAGAAAYAPLRDAAKVERPVLRTFASPAHIAERAEFARRSWGPLGLDAVSAACAESGLEGDGFVSRVQLAAANPTGVLAALRGRPLSQDDLMPIPDDATVALALRGEDGSFERLLLGVLGGLIGQQVDQDMGMFVQQIAQRTDVDMREDLIAHAESCAVAWSAPSQGGIGFTGAVAAVPLKDAKAFAEHLDAMWQKMTDVAPSKARDRAENRRISHRAYLEQFVHGGRPTWWVDLIDDDMPFAFSWTSTDRHFLLGLLPQPLRCAVDQTAVPNFDHALARKPLVARRGTCSAMFYLDVADLLRQAYAPGLMLLAVGSYEWQREGFDFDLADVPRLQSLLPHVGPELAVLQQTPQGFAWTRKGSLPLLDPLLMTCGMAGLMAFDR